jgi:short-subunit dehydrogenase
MLNALLGPQHSTPSPAFIVTGAAGGIGLATARLLKERGARLALWDQNADALQKAADELGERVVPVDVTQPASVEQAMAQSLEYLGALNGVIHAAGILNAGLFDQKTFDSHRRVIEVNLFGTVNVAYAVLPHLKQTRGSLVMLASSSAFYGAPEYAVYGASKAGVLSFAQSLRLECESKGIHIGVVSPLFVSTPMIDGYNGDTHMIRSRSPFFETRSPEAVAQVILDGIAHRRFMIYPGWRPRLLFWMSRYLNFVIHPLTRMTYKQGGG